ncbi:unnamed protein product [Lupinus luteus]|uniref:Uncharacterized protein n=1 Tax=Lupinus luteus TaxID=3873 RepID=A0AAV1XI65_LUPLU
MTPNTFSIFEYIPIIIRDNPQLIEKIVKDIKHKKFDRYPPELQVDRRIVGIDKSCEEIQALLSKDTNQSQKNGSYAIEGITLDFSNVDGLLSLSVDAFNLMTKLRFLKLHIPLEKRPNLFHLSIDGFNSMNKFKLLTLEKRSVKVDYPRVLNKFFDKMLVDNVESVNTQVK